MSYIGASPNSMAFLTDQFSGNGSTTTFTLSAAPAGSSSILVSVSGVLQDPSTYGVVGTTLTLGGAAPAGTGNISVRYLGIPASGVVTTAYRTVTEFTATAGQTTFTPPSYTVGYISVYLNGARLGSSDFTASNGTTIVLATGASVDDLVVTESFYVSSIAGAIPNTPGAVVESNINDGAVTAAKLAANTAGNPPAFSATLTTPVTGAAAGYYPFNNSAFTEQYDYGNNFNASTGVFTAPVSGIYMFNVAIAYSSNGASTDCNYELIVNGNSNTLSAFNPSLLGAVNGVDGPFWIQQPIMVYVAAGQTVYMRLYTSDGSWNLTSSTKFQGVLLRNV